MSEGDSTTSSVEEQGLLEPVEVHQATGMLIAQLGLSPRQALAVLRAHTA